MTRVVVAASRPLRRGSVCGAPSQVMVDDPSLVLLDCYLVSVGTNTKEMYVA